MWQKCSVNGSKCSNEIGSYKCECLHGYSGDGFQCTDINECQLNLDSDFKINCQVNSQCINTPGGYKCECLGGYKLEESKCVGKNLKIYIHIDFCYYF